MRLITEHLDVFFVARKMGKNPFYGTDALEVVFAEGFAEIDLSHSATVYALAQYVRSL